MSAHLDVIAETVARLRFTSPTSASWYGQPAIAIPAGLRRALSATQVSNGLAYLVQRHLYQHVYVTGSPSPARSEPELVPADSARTEFVQRLSAANTGTGGWDAGWAAPVEAAPRVVSKGGLRVWAKPQAGPPGCRQRRLRALASEGDDLHLARLLRGRG